MIEESIAIAVEILTFLSICFISSAELNEVNKANAYQEIILLTQKNYDQIWKISKNFKTSKRADSNASNMKVDIECNSKMNDIEALKNVY